MLVVFSHCRPSDGCCVQRIVRRMPGGKQREFFTRSPGYQSQSGEAAPRDRAAFPIPGDPRTLLDTAAPRFSHGWMKSPVADAARRSLQEDIKRMSPEQRLAAFLAHCQLMAQLARAGDTARQPARESAPTHAD